MNLPALLKRKAKEAERLGALQAAAAWRGASEVVSEELFQYVTEPLSLSEAAKESGYAPESLGRMIREGKVENMGEKHTPLIRRCDLPKKPGMGAPEWARTHLTVVE